MTPQSGETVARIAARCPRSKRQQKIARQESINCKRHSAKSRSELETARKEKETVNTRLKETNSKLEKAQNELDKARKSEQRDARINLHRLRNR